MLSESYVGLDSFVFSVLLNNYIHLWREKAGNAVNVTSGASFLCQIVVLLFLRWTRPGPVRIQELWEALLVILFHIQTSLCLLHYLSISLCHLSDSELLRLRLIQCSCLERSESRLVPAGWCPAHVPTDQTLSACLLYLLVFPLFIHCFFLFPHLLLSLYFLTSLPLSLPHISFWFVVMCHKWIGNCLVTTWDMMVHLTLQQHYGCCVLATLPPWS